MSYLVGKNANTITKSEFTASAGQTSVSFISDLNVEQLAVYKNGVRLNKADFLATSNLITFNVPLVQGDEIIVESVVGEIIAEPTELFKRVADTVVSYDAVNTPDGEVIYFKGRGTVGDGGGGIFRYSKSSIQTSDGGLIFAPAGGGRLIRDGWTAFGFNGQLNVRWFGAKGDGVADDTVALQSAINASNGNKVLAPQGRYRHSDIVVPKSVHMHLTGEFASYYDTEGTVFDYIGTGIGLQVGVDDGNPDITGPLRGATITDIHFTTTSGLTAVRLQNTALGVIERCKTRNFLGKVIDLRANVITRVRDNDIAGSLAGSACYGIYCDEQYFGNYVIDICDNHIFQVNHAGRFSEGRSLTVHNNIVENVRPGANGGVWKFDGNGYISTASFCDNYYENHQGWVFDGSGFVGAILNLVVKDEDGWGSVDSSNVNPGVGNLPKTKVFTHDISGNFFVDAAWNNKAYLSLASVYPTTTIFDPSSTVVLEQVTNRQYEDDLVYTFRQTEMLKSAGDFADLTGGIAGTFKKTGGTPTGWTDMAAPDWELIADGIHGTFVCYVPGAGDYDRCNKSISLTPLSRARYFAMAFTVKGWVALSVNGDSLYDSGASISDWKTVVVTFSVPANASSFLLKFGTNSPNPFYIAEARLVEVGVADVNEPGTLNEAVRKALHRTMKRGAY